MHPIPAPPSPLSTPPFSHSLPLLVFPPIARSLHPLSSPIIKFLSSSPTFHRLLSHVLSSVPAPLPRHNEEPSYTEKTWCRFLLIISLCAALPSLSSPAPSRLHAFSPSFSFCFDGYLGNFIIITVSSWWKRLYIWYLSSSWSSKHVCVCVCVCVCIHTCPRASFS